MIIEKLKIKNTAINPHTSHQYMTVLMNACHVMSKSHIPPTLLVPIISV
jgi:hypothetical protein